MYLQLSTSMLFCLLSTSVMAADKSPLADEADRINYSIGHQIGTDFKRQKVELNKQALKLGLQHGHHQKVAEVHSKL